jgi:AcrR family transcriptional regulator
MQELTAYKISLKPAILAEATRCFREYGIRAVKMDDIAKNLGVSKRTLYEIYSNKEDVLVDVVAGLLKERDAYLKKYAAECDNVIDVLLEVLRLQIAFSASTHANFFTDLHRYPAAEQMLKEFNVGQSKASDEFFQKGVKQGYFRSDINYAVFQKISSGSLRMIRTDVEFSDLSYQQLFENYLCVVIRGICTAKGLERFDAFVSQCE